MNLLRGTGRALLGAFFIANGVKAVRNPDALVEATEPLAERLVPLAQKTLPGAVSAYVPEDTRTLVRAGGVAGILGGLGMATGIAPQAGGTLAALSMVPSLAAANPRGASDRRAALGEFTTRLALAGAALVVSQDTRGRPSVFWRAQASTARIGRSAVRAVGTAQAEAAAVGRRATRRAARLERRAAAAAQKAQRKLAKKAGDVRDALDAAAPTA